MRTYIAIIRFIIMELLFVKGFYWSIMSLFLRRDDNGDMLIIDLFQLLDVRITRIRTSVGTIVSQGLIGLVNLTGKLINIITFPQDSDSSIHHVTVHYQPMLFIHHYLPIITRMNALTTFNLNTIRIGGVY